MQSLWTGLSAMKSATDWLNRVGDNLANLNTVGFAQDQQSFADALTMQLYPSATSPANANRMTPPGWRGGTGVVSVAQGRKFDGMKLQQTGGKLDFAISGPGFFEVQGPQGKVYTKAGDFIWSARPDGRFQLATQQGYPVLSSNGQPIVRPTNNAAISVGPNGQIFYGKTMGPRLAMVEIGQPSSHLQAQGDNLYALTAGASAKPAQNSTVLQGFLSYSNVDEATQFADMEEAERMFELNSESVQLANKMMGIADTIRT